MKAIKITEENVADVLKELLGVEEEQECQGCENCECHEEKVQEEQIQELPPFMQALFETLAEQKKAEMVKPAAQKVSELSEKLKDARDKVEDKMNDSRVKLLKDRLEEREKTIKELRAELKTVNMKAEMMERHISSLQTKCNKLNTELNEANEALAEMNDMQHTQSRPASAFEAIKRNEEININRTDLDRDKFSIMTRESQELIDLMRLKAADYGGSFEKMVDRFGMIAAVIPLQNKVDRIITTVENGGPKLKSESIEDSVRDLAGYALMTLAHIKMNDK